MKGYAEREGGSKPYYNPPESPLKDAITAILGKAPPFDLTGIIFENNIEEDVAIELYEWCSSNANPCWATGDSIVEAAELIVKRAIENANI